jgi:hypothetical protein
MCEGRIKAASQAQVPLMKSPCTSNRHSEYTCLIKWGVSSKKFKVEKWCKECISHHSHTHIVQEYLATNEREKENNIENIENTDDSESKPRRGRKKKSA